MVQEQKLIEIEGGLAILKGRQTAIVGDNAEGKSQLVDLMLGARRERGMTVRYDFSPAPTNYVSDNVRYITFRDSYGASDANYYLQLRWNQMDIDEETPTVREMLRRACGSGGDTMKETVERLCAMFGLDRLMDKVIISLSSGELRKFQLVKALSAAPRVLVLDNPFIGLDVATRAQLTDVLRELVEDCGITMVLVLARNEEIPDFIDTVIPVRGMEAAPAMDKDAYLKASAVPSRADVPCFGTEGGDGDEILHFRKVSIVYDERTILKDLDWTVHKGEHWALTGENGSGKSTLLSLVCADNPQAYACDIDLFGRRRGTGETIWDIKKHIGYVSPEMHRSYNRNIPAIDIVASGLFDTIGLYRKPTDAQKASCMGWMERFGIADLADRSFLKLSSGEQRLCLLARAFVKEPDLLILDEPMHGLDEHRCEMVRGIVDEYCSNPSVTLVMVTHYVHELPACIDKCLTLKRN